MKPALQDQVNKTSGEKGRPFYAPPTLLRSRSLHGGANVENLHSDYDRIEDGGVEQKGQETGDLIKTKPMKTNISSGRDASSSSDKRRKPECKKKRKRL